MKTIEIQKDAKLNDIIYVFVNGEKHLMRCHLASKGKTVLQYGK